MKIIVATNIRGGCGKTTNVLHLAVAASLARKNNRVLAVDLDPQAHLTHCLLPQTVDGSHHYIDDLLQGEAASPLETHYKNLSIIPSRMKLTRIQDTWLLGKPRWEELLLRALARFKDDFDYVFIDTPAAYFKIHVLAIRASDAYIISMRPEAFSLVGFAESIGEIEGFKKELDLHTPVYAGYFLNGVPKAKRLAIERIRETISSEFKKFSGAAYEIQQSNLFDEARWSPKQSIFLYPGTKALQANYKTAWKRLSERVGA